MKYRIASMFLLPIGFMLAGLIFWGMIESVNYQPTGQTRIVEVTHKSGSVIYKAQYEAENWMTISIWKTMIFERFNEPCSNGYHMLGLIERFGQPPKDGSLECAKKRIDKYLADIENQEGWKVVKTEYIKYP